MRKEREGEREKRKGGRNREKGREGERGREGGREGGRRDQKNAVQEHIITPIKIAAACNENVSAP